MRLNFVELCGFRGFREKVRFDFAPGFTVLSGRNGVGKSTVFDAVEFALTGSINKYVVGKTANDAIKDYIWWRGEGRPADFYVTASFIDEGGKEVVVTRHRTHGSNLSTADIESALCDDGGPEDALRQLCRTSILRDELIAALSLDLSDTERFELVRLAIGPAEGAGYLSKAKEVVAVADAAHAEKRRAHEAIGARLTDAVARLAEVKSSMEAAGNVAEAMSILHAAVGNATEDVSDRMLAGWKLVADRNLLLKGWEDGVALARDFIELRSRVESEDAMRETAATREAMEHLSRAFQVASMEVDEAEKAVKAEERADEVVAALVALVEHGQRVGLHEDKCPLCAARRTADEFDEGLALARKRIERLSSGVLDARTRLHAARVVLEAISQQRDQVLRAWNSIVQLGSELKAKELRLRDHFESFPLDSPS